MLPHPHWLLGNMTYAGVGVGISLNARPSEFTAIFIWSLQWTKDPAHVDPVFRRMQPHILDTACLFNYQWSILQSSPGSLCASLFSPSVLRVSSAVTSILVVLIKVHNKSFDLLQSNLHFLYSNQPVTLNITSGIIV